MQLRFYNTASRKVEDFHPLIDGEVRMYHCGPTVYQRPHIGNFRAFLFADLLRRLFDLLDYKVIQVMNLTDVGHLLNDADDGEDKLEVQARKEKIDPWELVEKVSKQFFIDLDALDVRPAHHYPRATDHIPEMVEIIRTLLEKGHAYKVGENIYFDVHSFPGYGNLSGNRIEELEAGARIQVNEEKRHPADFALWKSDERHIMKWDTEFGANGFPGWHVECSAMAMKYLGESFDIHTGGEDNVFPHHECEIAQSECATGVTFATTWMHTKFLKVDGGKMSKSLGNAYDLDDIAERGYSPLDFRFLILKSHYRGSLNFSWDALKSAAEGRSSLADFKGRLEAGARESDGESVNGIGDDPAANPDSLIARAESKFFASVCEDLNTSAALSAVFDLRNHFIKQGLPPDKCRQALAFLSKVDGLFGLFESAEGGEDAQRLSDADVEKLIALRIGARASNDWAQSDAIRDQLAGAGVVVEDTADGMHWHRG